MNKAEVSALLAMLSEVYPRRIGSGDARRTAALWSMVLADAAPAPVLAAAVGWMRSNKPHPPTPGELLATLGMPTGTRPRRHGAGFAARCNA